MLAHSRREVPSELGALEAALALCSERFLDVGLQLDVKRRGVEETVVALLRRFDLRDRAWISSFSAAVLLRHCSGVHRPAV